MEGSREDTGGIGAADTAAEDAADADETPPETTAVGTEHERTTGGGGSTEGTRGETEGCMARDQTRLLLLLVLLLCSASLLSVCSDFSAAVVWLPVRACGVRAAS